MFLNQLTGLIAKKRPIRSRKLVLQIWRLTRSLSHLPSTNGLLKSLRMKAMILEVKAKLDHPKFTGART
jgi:hypothetical protein